MQERNEASCANPASSRNGNAVTAGRKETESPTRQERLSLVGALQSRGLSQADPLLANLEVLNGDLLYLAYWLREGMERSLGAGAGSAEGQFTRQADTFLRVVRQIDRFAQLCGRTTKPAAPASRVS